MVQSDRDMGLTSDEHDTAIGVGEGADGMAEPYRGVGDDLRRERERVGWSIVDVSQRLKIRRAYIEAIETGDADAMPGHSYALGFVRSYAELMGADGELCVDYYKQETSGHGKPLDLHFPVPSQESRRPGIGALALCALLVAGAYGAYYYFQNNGLQKLSLVPDVPDEISRQVRGVVDREEESSATGAAGTTPATPADVAAAGNSPAPDGVASVSIAAMTSTEAHAATPDDGLSGGGVNASAPQVGQVRQTPVQPPVIESAPTIAADQAATGEAPAEDAATTSGAVPVAQVVPTASVPAARSDTLSRAPSETVQENPQAADEATSEPVTRVAALIPPPPLPSAERDDRSPRAFGDTDQARIIVKVTRPVHVIVSRVDGRRMLDRKLIVGDTYSVPDQSGLVLRADDVTALKLKLDGKDLALPVSVGKAEFPLAASWLSQYR